mmetsp:Transcript_6621/g.15266  ORF Transcript_6621/g.15266 Transcript_6621/m.15266 type:complete len:744 (-) Transcript_6621:56-2287(-)
MMKKTLLTDHKPVLEIRGVQRLGNDGKRWRLNLADGRHVATGVAYTDVANQIAQYGDSIGLWLQLEKYSMEYPSGKTALLVMILEAKVVGRTPRDQLTADSSLAKLTPEHVAQGIGTSEPLPATQAVAEEHRLSSNSSTSAGAYLTPERRTMTVPDTTPNPPMAPRSRSPRASDGGRTFARDIDRCAAEAPTQPGFVDAPAMQPATSNPYSVPQFAPGTTASAGALNGSNPYGSAAPTPSAPAPALGMAAGSSAASRFSGSGSTAPGNATVTPVSALNAYTGGRWKIKARVLTKGDVRKFNNQRGEGQLFKVDLGDKTGEISATFFGRAVDKYYSLLKPEKVYTFQKGQIKPANKRYDRGDHVLVFEEHALIEAVGEDEDIPKISYTFHDLAEVQSREPDSHMDVKAVIYAVQDPFTFTAKTSGKEMTKRVVHLWDASGDPTSGSSCELTFWGEKALSNEFQVGQAIFLKTARVSEFNGQKSLSSPAGYQLSPDSEHAFLLLRHYQQLQATSPHVFQMRTSWGGSSSKRQTIEELRQEDIGLGPPPVQGQALLPGEAKSIHRHWVTATFLNMGDRAPYYYSCPHKTEGSQPPAAGQPPVMRTCNKKVTQEPDGFWTCAAGHKSAQPDFRYLCRIEILDHTDKVEVNLYDEQMLKLLQCPAKDYVQIFDAGTNNGEREAELRQLNGRMEWRKCLLRLRAQKEIWQENERVRYSVDEVQPVAYVQDAKQMLSEVHEALATLPHGY